MKLGFTKSVADSNLYYKVVDGQSLILVLYMDDLFLTGAEKFIEWCKQQLASEFEMKDLGLMHYFLGLEVWQPQEIMHQSKVWQRKDDIFLSQGRYTIDILRRFMMMDCKSMTTLMTMNLKKLSTVAADSDLVDPTVYRQLVGSLMYLVNTRPNICFAVSTLGQFMCESRQMHWVAAKHVLRYLHGIVGYGLRYTSSSDLTLVSYSNFHWAGSVEDRKSTFGC
jgi:hypothetical protein